VKVPDDLYEKVKQRVYRRISAELRRARAIADIGCGDCTLARFLSRERRDRRVVGIDVSETSFPRHGSRSGRLRCLKADARALPLLDRGMFDAAVSVYSLHELGAPMACLREVRRLLRPGGKLLVVDFPRGSLAQRLWSDAAPRGFCPGHGQADGAATAYVGKGIQGRDFREDSTVDVIRTPATGGVNHAVGERGDVHGMRDVYRRMPCRRDSAAG
jgi:SAM-dependent methyltransferase